MIQNRQGNIILDTEMVTELIGSTVAEMVYEGVWQEGEILGWTLDIPEVEVHYSVDIDLNEDQ